MLDSLNNPDAALPKDGSGVTTDLVNVTLNKAPDVTHNLTVQAEGVTPAVIIPRKVLNQKTYVYKGSDLGIRISLRGPRSEFGHQPQLMLIYCYITPRRVL